MATKKLRSAPAEVKQMVDNLIDAYHAEQDAKPACACHCTVAKAEAHMADVTLSAHGSLWLFRPQSDAARAWVDEYVPSDSQWFGESLVVEQRYGPDLLNGMRDAGLSTTWT